MTSTHTATPPGGRAQPETVRVLIADDHAVVRDGLRVLVDANPDMIVIGEASNGQEAWLRACDLRPDVLLLDLSMPGIGGVETAERIAQDCPTVRVLALTMHEERGYVSRLLRAGAAGYVLKRTASGELVRAIRTVAAGGRYIDPSLAGMLLGAQAGRRTGDIDGLAQATSPTPREAEILRLVARGYSNKEIAATLDISVKTVETHKANGMTKLDLPNRAALVRYAQQEGWFGEGR